MYTPVNPSFTVFKWGFKGSKLYRHVFVMNKYKTLSICAGCTAVYTKSIEMPDMQDKTSKNFNYILFICLTSATQTLKSFFCIFSVLGVNLKLLLVCLC